jgi:hypothetical protein
LIDGRAELGLEIAQAESDIKEYLVAEFNAFLQSPNALYAVQSTANGDIAREKIIFERIENIVHLGENHMTADS